MGRSRNDFRMDYGRSAFLINLTARTEAAEEAMLEMRL